MPTHTIFTTHLHLTDKQRDELRESVSFRPIPESWRYNPQLAPGGGFTQPYPDQPGAEQFEYAEYKGDQQQVLIGSVDEYKARIKQLVNDSSRVLWYRGQASSLWKLVPKLYRGMMLRGSMGMLHGERVTYAHFEYASPRNIVRIVNAARDQLGLSPLADIEALFVAQHYNAASPFLDWSARALVALWFALESKLDRCDSEYFGPDVPCVWICDPAYLAVMNGIVSDQCSDGVPLSGIRYQLHEWIDNPDDEYVPTRQLPFPILPDTLKDGRIDKQKGRFTFCGPRGNWHFDDHRYQLQIDSAGNPVDMDYYGYPYARLFIDPQARESILEELDSMGFSENTIYGSRKLDNLIDRGITDAGISLDPLGDWTRELKKERENREESIRKEFGL